MDINKAIKIIKSNHYRIERINLHDHKITNTQILKLIIALTENINLHTVSFTNCEISKIGFGYLSQFFKSTDSNNITLLQFNGNLSKDVKEQAENIQKIVDTNRIDKFATLTLDVLNFNNKDYSYFMDGFNDTSYIIKKLEHITLNKEMLTLNEGFFVNEKHQEDWIKYLKEKRANSESPLFLDEIKEELLSLEKENKPKLKSLAHKIEKKHVPRTVDKLANITLSLIQEIKGEFSYLCDGMDSEIAIYNSNIPIGKRLWRAFNFSEDMFLSPNHYRAWQKYLRETFSNSNGNHSIDKIKEDLITLDNKILEDITKLKNPGTDSIKLLNSTLDTKNISPLEKKKEKLTNNTTTNDTSNQKNNIKISDTDKNKPSKKLKKYHLLMNPKLPNFH